MAFSISYQNPKRSDLVVNSLKAYSWKMPMATWIQSTKRLNNALMTGEAIASKPMILQ